MKWIWMMVFLVSTNATAQDCSKPGELQTVDAVDLERYMGTWYEIASIPQSFQEGCVATEAHYRLTWLGYVRVTNSCRLKSFDGELNRARGFARVVDDAGSKLEVTFFWPFWGDYWIIELDDDYQWAVVGAPDRNALWILSRERQMDEALYETLMSMIGSKHCYDTSLIKRSLQPVD